MILLMQGRGLSQGEVATLSGVPQPTINRILSGNDPRESTVKRLRTALQKHFPELSGEKEAA